METQATVSNADWSLKPRLRGTYSICLKILSIMERHGVCACVCSIVFEPFTHIPLCFLGKDLADISLHGTLGRGGEKGCPHTWRWSGIQCGQTLLSVALLETCKSTVSFKTLLLCGYCLQQTVAQNPETSVQGTPCYFRVLKTRAAMKGWNQGQRKKLFSP